MHEGGSNGYLHTLNDVEHSVVAQAEPATREGVCAQQVRTRKRYVGCQRDCPRRDVAERSNPRWVWKLAHER
jgi:hypothetical protein